MIADQEEMDIPLDVEPLYERATKVRGTVEPGTDNLTVSLPDGTEIEADIKKNGKWSAKLPKGSLTAGDIIAITQTIGIYTGTVDFEMQPKRSRPNGGESTQ
jgi:hypothetical protein